MGNVLIILNFECEDVTGKYITMAFLERKRRMYVVHYVDFENVTTISRTRRDLDYWIPAMLRTMLAEESGIVPKVRFLSSEYWEKENPPFTAG